MGCRVDGMWGNQVCAKERAHESAMNLRILRPLFVKLPRNVSREQQSNITAGMDGACTRPTLPTGSECYIQWF
jgi:hypothetical protein